MAMSSGLRISVLPIPASTAPSDPPRAPAISAMVSPMGSITRFSTIIVCARIGAAAAPITSVPIGKPTDPLLLTDMPSPCIAQTPASRPSRRAQRYPTANTASDPAQYPAR